MGPVKLFQYFNTDNQDAIAQDKEDLKYMTHKLTEKYEQAGD